MRSTMSRRRFLMGTAGATLALPALELFTPREAIAGTPPPRLLVYYFPNGRRPEWWVPSAGAGLTFPAQAAALQPFADQALSLVNLTNLAAIGSPGAAHAMGTGTVMTGSTIPDVAGGQLHNDISLDQLVVQQLAPDTRFSSLQWSAGEPGPCDVGGSSCAYTQSLSWTGPAGPLVPTIDPRAAFERLFGTGVDGLQGPAADIRRQSLQSTVDFVRDDARALQARLGHEDQLRLEEYFTALTELEKSLTSTVGECDAELTPPIGGLAYPERVAAFHQLIKLAFQCDQTRVMTFMIEFGLSGRSHDFLGAPGAHHALSHYGDQTGRDRLEAIETWHAQQLGGLLQLLRDTPGTTAGTLLDETIVLAMPSMGEGNGHDHAHNCPILFGGTGVIAADGRQIAFNAATPEPLPNLHVSLLQAFGIEGTFGSNGAIFGDHGTATIPGIVL
ncbi:DUF1552 domain-containing protein [Paraliomyxa miuraensis]|uniref:DUF1552 domain-containing protein n=1 Tax=Paraliomyxa miuraensis TaxID=376150 RepID=UPI002250826F|nr:DUF1552 domain-containing protein [Paraliomyxa miuraensis]MCX4240804.1 DUF1552 domain-containing protein [Paraliomyxa miuraensis]